MGKQYTLSGISADVQLGKGGARFKWDASIVKFRDAADTAFVAGQFLSVITPRVGTTDATSVFLRANNTDYQEIDSSGDMGFGTAAGATHNYAFKKDKNGNSIFLIENSNAGSSSECDLWLRSGANDLRIGITSPAFPGFAGAAFFEHKGGKSLLFYSPTLKFAYDSNQDSFYTNKAVGLGVGTATVPHAAVGAGLFAVEGANASVLLGPHAQFTTPTDNFPLLQFLNWQHDDISLAFDAYYDGAWKSSDAGSNYRLAKNTDLFSILYDSGIAGGSGVTWNTAFSVNAATEQVTLAKGQVVNTTAVTTTTYSILTSDFFLPVSAPVGGSTLTLPASPVAGQSYEIADEAGNASTRNITIDTADAATIDGAATKVISQDYGAIVVRYTGSMWKVM